MDLVLSNFNWNNFSCNLSSFLLGEFARSDLAVYFRPRALVQLHYNKELSGAHSTVQHSVVSQQGHEVQSNMGRLENGLRKIRSTANRVDDMKVKLATKEEELAIKNEETNKLTEIFESESAKVTREKEAADHEVSSTKKYSIR